MLHTLTYTNKAGSYIDKLCSSAQEAAEYGLHLTNIKAGTPVKITNEETGFEPWHACNGLPLLKRIAESDPEPARGEQSLGPSGAMSYEAWGEF